MTDRPIRLSDSDSPLSESKQKWLNLAYRDLREIRDMYESDNPMREKLTNILATLILVDSE